MRSGTQLLPEVASTIAGRVDALYLFLVGLTAFFTVLIVAIFMHMAWERLTLIYAILIPPAVLMVFIVIMATESEYTHWLRVLFFRTGT